MEFKITQTDREQAVKHLVRLCAQARGLDPLAQDYAAMLAELQYRIDPKSAWRAVKYGEKAIRALVRRKAA
jgi:hypothetical protein